MVWLCKEALSNLSRITEKFKVTSLSYLYVPTASSASLKSLNAVTEFFCFDSNTFSTLLPIHFLLLSIISISFHMVVVVAGNEFEWSIFYWRSGTKGFWPARWWTLIKYPSWTICCWMNDKKKGLRQRAANQISI